MKSLINIIGIQLVSLTIVSVTLAGDHQNFRTDDENSENIIFKNVYGLANKAWHVANTSDSKYGIGSMDYYVKAQKLAPDNYAIKNQLNVLRRSLD